MPSIFNHTDHPSLFTLISTHSQDLPLLASHRTGPAWTEIFESASALALQIHSKSSETTLALMEALRTQKEKNKKQNTKPDQ